MIPWSQGAQLVCMNQQTSDVHMRITIPECHKLVNGNRIFLFIFSQLFLFNVQWIFKQVAEFDVIAAGNHQPQRVELLPNEPFQVSANVEEIKH
jgi:hypothetical protein